VTDNEVPAQPPLTAAHTDAGAAMPRYEPFHVHLWRLQTRREKKKKAIQEAFDNPIRPRSARPHPSLFFPTSGHQRKQKRACPSLPSLSLTHLSDSPQQARHHPSSVHSLTQPAGPLAPTPPLPTVRTMGHTKAERPARVAVPRSPSWQLVPAHARLQAPPMAAAATQPIIMLKILRSPTPQYQPTTAAASTGSNGAPTHSGAQ